MRRRLENGDFLVMYEDSPIIEGYKQNLTNENHYIQIMPECILREEYKCSDCATPVIKQRCTIGRPLDCVECEERKT